MSFTFFQLTYYGIDCLFSIVCSILQKIARLLSVKVIIIKLIYNWIGNFIIFWAFFIFYFFHFLFFFKSTWIIRFQQYYQISQKYLYCSYLTSFFFILYQVMCFGLCFNSSSSVSYTHLTLPTILLV